MYIERERERDRYMLYCDFDKKKKPIWFLILSLTIIDNSSTPPPPSLPSIIIIVPQLLVYVWIVCQLVFCFVFVLLYNQGCVVSATYIHIYIFISSIYAKKRKKNMSIVTTKLYRSLL